MRAITATLLLVSCASFRPSPAELAVLQKTAADGIGDSYLEYCESVVRPRCVDEDRDAADAGWKQTKEQRVACLRPCDSVSAEKVATAVDILRTAQTTLYFVIKKGDATPEEIEDARSQVARSVSALSSTLRELGIFSALSEAFGR